MKCAMFFFIVIVTSVATKHNFDVFIYGQILLSYKTYNSVNYKNIYYINIFRNLCKLIIYVAI